MDNVQATDKNNMVGTAMPTSGVLEGTNQVQVPPDPIPEVKTSDELKFSTKFAQLSKREYALVQRERELKEREAKYKTYEEKKANAKTNPDEYLQEAGLDYEYISNLKLNGGKPSPEMELLNTKNDLNSLREEIKNLQNQLKERDEEGKKSQIEKETQNFKHSIKATVLNAKEKYELINANDAYEAVYDTIVEFFQKHPEFPQEKRVLSIEQAADMVENYYVEEAKKYLGLTKVKSMFETSNKPNDASNSQSIGQQVVSSSPTLTNQQTTFSNPAGKRTLLSEQDSIKEAAKMLRWK